VTTLAEETLVGQEADLLARLKGLLDGHPAGGAFKLLLAPAALRVADDEVLVQVYDAERGVAELRPRKLSEVTLDDVLHPAQVIDPADEALRGYALAPVHHQCWETHRPDGSRGHVYTM
jgi:hypothetical protein